MSRFEPEGVTNGTEDPAGGDANVLHWLSNQTDWRRLIEASRLKAVLAFKHSASCSVSAHVLNEVTEFLSRKGNVSMGLVDVLEERQLSNAIAQETGIPHESPQLIAILNERPIWHASHWSIDLDELERLLLELGEPAQP